jgi:hypothetical protein
MRIGRVQGCLAAALVALIGGGDVGGAPNKPPVPDLTRGGRKDDKHHWKLKGSR